MRDRTRDLFRSVVAIVLALGILGTATPSTAAAREYDECVDQPLLALFDPDGDEVLTLAELKRAAGLFPGNEELQVRVEAAEESGLVGIRYDGLCQTQSTSVRTVRGESGESVAGDPGESVVGKSGESVVGEAGESVVAVGKPGESVVAIGKSGESAVGQDGESVIGEDGESAVGQDGESAVSQDGDSVFVDQLPRTGVDEADSSGNTMDVLLLGAGGVLMVAGVATFRQGRNT